ncbi:hypothetical protein BCR34DRAFT_584541 [Clohesyomyces aquaticus]|uniref:Uncharacterized protein n=1 Tax=Clohesyomyces aquaticus TaxID=1231657 RepID=A0A1Y2A0Q5_9PLEO|nr:hypothetical protein BCR34DRAFT_584541 [Clohesyomyces aquaticus]
MSSQGQNLWQEALQTLPDEDRSRYELLMGKGAGHKDIITDVLAATEERKEECKRKRWKVKFRGKAIILRDLLDKVAVWIHKFVAVGDNAVQYDPGHAALPWAAVRFILKATVNEVEIFGAILQGVESISKSLARCAIMENLYLYSNFEISNRLRQSLVELYAATLRFLGKALGYYTQNTAARVAKSLILTVGDVESWANPIQEKQRDVDRLITLGEAERARQAGEHLTELRTGQFVHQKSLEETYSALQRLSNGLLDPIFRIDKQVTMIQDELERQKRIDIIKSISTINFAAQHKVANANLLPDSGKWFLRKPQFEEWRDESCSSVLWLHGIPGSGKTKLTSTVISLLKPTSHMAYFYCVRNPAEPERAECDRILASLVRQLACPSPNVPILPPVVSRYEDALDGLMEYDDISWSFEETVQVLIELCDLYPAVFFILDALDEVNPLNRLDLLDALLRVIEESQALVKVFISSRENMDIVARLEDTPNLRIGAKENTEDIAKFVHQQLKAANLLNGRLPAFLKEKIPETLIEDAQGMFRWVDLQIQSLRPLKVAGDIEARLGRLPRTLQDSYFEIFERIQGSGEYAFKLAVFTFQWLLYARQPIAMNDFALLSTVQSTGNNIYTTYEVLDVCQNLVVSNDQGIFRFAHLSVREFLENLATDQAGHDRAFSCFSEAEGNAAIASTCLSYLKTTMESAAPKTDSHLSTTRQMTDNQALREYTANYWPLHVSQSGQLKFQPPLSVEVRSFLIKDKDVAPSFTHWCTLVTEKLRGNALPEIREAAQLPANPIWLAHTYDIIEIRHVAIDDKTRQAKAFVYAASTGNTKVMLALLEQGFDIKGIGIDAMNAAIIGRHGEAILILLDLHVPADPDRLLNATVESHTNVVVPLVKNGLKNFSMAQLERALAIATANGDFESVAAFLEMGVEKDPYAVVRYLKAGTPYAALHLINTGFDIHGKYLLEERTALHWACAKGLLSVVIVLVEKGVGVNIGDVAGNTALHLASWRGRVNVVQYLLEHEADAQLLNRDGQLALHITCLTGHSAVVHQLLPKTLDINLRDREGKTPLDYAKKWNHADIIVMFDVPSSETAPTHATGIVATKEISQGDATNHEEEVRVSPVFTDIPVIAEPPSTLPDNGKNSDTDDGRNLDTDLYGRNIQKRGCNARKASSVSFHAHEDKGSRGCGRLESV